MDSTRRVSSQVQLGAVLQLGSPGAVSGTLGSILPAPHSPTAMPNPKRLFLVKWSISADRMKLTPTFTRSSR